MCHFVWRFNINTQYPDHFVCLQQVNKGQWLIVFRRNNLSKQLFTYSAYENTYTYTEKYRDGNCNISLYLTINSSTFYACKFGYLEMQPIKEVNNIVYANCNINDVTPLGYKFLEENA